MENRKHLSVFIINRYINFGLLFIRGILMAKFLGPITFGVWGFLTLVLQYFTFSTLGVNYAVTVNLSTKKEAEEVKTGKVSSMAVLITALISLIILLLGLIVRILNIPLFSKFRFIDYIIPIVLIIGLNNLQQVLVNIYRVHQRIMQIAVIESLSAVVLLVSTVVFRNFDLIRYQLWFMVATSILSISILVFRLPFQYHQNWNKGIAKSLFSLGLPLLIYNFSFYLITISARTVVNIFYSKEILGYYTLANSISYAVLLGFQSIAWVIYPNILEKMSREIDGDKQSIGLEKVNHLFNTACFLISFLVVAAIPILFLYLPDYQPALPIVTLLLLSQVVLAVSYGSNAMAVAHGKQGSVAKISVVIVAFILIGSLSLSIMHTSPTWIALIVLLGSFGYSISQSIFSSHIIKSGNTFHQILSVISPGVFFAIILVITGTFINQSILFNFFAIIFFLVLDIKKLSLLGRFVFKEILHE